jgi:hypothetical protein
MLKEPLRLPARALSGVLLAAGAAYVWVRFRRARRITDSDEPPAMPSSGWDPDGP